MCLAAQGASAGEHDAAARFGNDVFMAGSNVVTDGSPGDALLAGAWVSTSGAVQGDEVATGGQLRLGADVDGALYAAGGHVQLDGKVARNARIAGGHVEIGPEADVQGGLTIGGGEVAVDGRVGKYLQVGAGSTRIDGHVGGDVDVASGELNIGPDAVIDGALTYYGPQPANVASGAVIHGGTHYVERKHWGPAGHHRRFSVAAWIWLAGWIVAGSVLLALWPGFSRSVSEAARRQPGIALLVGFAVLVCVPVALLFLTLSIIGIPLALLLLLLYLLLLPLGYLAAAAAIGEWLLARLRHGAAILTRERIFMLIGVLIVLFVLTRVPVLGGALRLLLVIAGIGSLAVASAARHRAAGAAAGETGTVTTT
jgi:cytoskeletal protein CcmA (bactofilin family)